MLPPIPLHLRRRRGGPRHIPGEGDGDANYIINYSRRITGERSIQGHVATALNNSDHGLRWVAFFPPT